MSETRLRADAPPLSGTDLNASVREAIIKLAEPSCTTPVGNIPCFGCRHQYALIIGMFLEGLPRALVDVEAIERAVKTSPYDA